MYWHIDILAVYLLGLVTNTVSRKLPGDCLVPNICEQICRRVGKNDVECSCHKQYQIAEDGRTCVYVHPDGKRWRPPKRLIPRKQKVEYLSPRMPESYSTKDVEDGSGSGLEFSNCDDEDGCSSSKSVTTGEGVLVYKEEASTNITHQSTDAVGISRSVLQTLNPFQLKGVASTFSSIKPEHRNENIPLLATIIKSQNTRIQYPISSTVDKVRMTSLLIQSKASAFQIDSEKSISDHSMLVGDVLKSMVPSTKLKASRIETKYLSSKNNFSQSSYTALAEGVNSLYHVIAPSLVLGSSNSLGTASHYTHEGGIADKSYSIVNIQKPIKRSQTLLLPSINSINYGVDHSNQFTTFSRLATEPLVSKYVPVSSKTVPSTDRIFKGMTSSLREDHSSRLLSLGAYPIKKETTDFIHGGNSVTFTKMRSKSSMTLLPIAINLEKQEHFTPRSSKSNFVLPQQSVIGNLSLLHKEINRSSRSPFDNLFRSINVEGIPVLYSTSHVAPPLPSTVVRISPSIQVNDGTSRISSLLDNIQSRRVHLNSTKTILSSILFPTKSLKTQHSVKTSFLESKQVEKNCTSGGCGNGGKCQNGVCLCPLRRGGMNCKSELLFEEPSFSGISYMEFSKQRGLYRRFKLLVDFITDAANGLLLHSSDKENGGRDFFSVGLRNGKAVFRFDCGSGISEIQSYKPVTLRKWHTLVVHRAGMRSWLQVDNEDKIHGYKPGRRRHLSLGKFYVGGTRNISSYANIGFEAGLTGCIRKVVINGNLLHIHSSDLEAIDGFGIGNCRHVSCKQSSCAAGSHCYIDRDETLSCICPFGRSGTYCNNTTPILLPSLQPRSYMSFKVNNYKEGFYLHFEMIIKPASHDSTGLLLYNADDEDGEGDYFYVALKKGTVVFQFDCGTGHTTIRSTEKLKTNAWNRILVSKKGRQGFLQINYGKKAIGVSPGNYNKLYLRQPLYVGGVLDFANLPRNVEVHDGFRGCIQKVTINHHDLVWKNADSGHNIHNCRNHPCVANPCGGHGTCEPRYETFVCHCDLGYKGKRCTKSSNLLVPSFRSHSYLALDDQHVIDRVNGNVSELSITFKSEEPDGSLLWIGKGNAYHHGDYSGLYLENGYLIYKYNLGDGDVTMKSMDPVNDGKWHVAHVKRVNGNGMMLIDAVLHSDKKRHGTYTVLNAIGSLYLGHAPYVSRRARLGSAIGFTGCIRNLKLNGNHVDIMKAAAKGHDITSCTAG